MSIHITWYVAGYSGTGDTGSGENPRSLIAAGLRVSWHAMTLVDPQPVRPNYGDITTVTTVT